MDGLKAFVWDTGWAGLAGWLPKLANGSLEANGSDDQGDEEAAPAFCVGTEAKGSEPKGSLLPNGSLPKELDVEWDGAAPVAFGAGKLNADKGAAGLDVGMCWSSAFDSLFFLF